MQCSPCLTSSPDLVAELARFATVSHRLRITSLRSMLSPRLEHTTFLPFSQWFLPFRHVTAQGGAPVARAYSPRRLRTSPWLSVPACFAIARRIAMFTASYRPLSLCAALAIALAVASWAPIAAHSTSLLPHFALERPTAECQPSGCPTTGSLAHNPVPPSWRVMVVPALPSSTARTYIHL